MIDLRSDTVTKPTSAMREAIAKAVVGDDVLDVDPTIDALEKATAELLGKEDAIFMPSGTMTNQIALRVHCSPGDEFICDEGCHIYNYEQGAYAQLSGLATRTLEGQQGVIQLDHLKGKVRPDDDHMTRTRLLTIENTHNRGGGKVQPFDNVAEACRWAHEHGLKTHLDGARLMNAVVASGIEPKTWADNFDTVSVCFSKGLGAPVGSALAGSQQDITSAKRHRKAFGGGMRQAGVIAAAALYALQNNVERLAEDHEKAQRLSQAIAETEGLEIIGESVDTNIVMFRVADGAPLAAEIVRRMEEQDVYMLAINPSSIRAVTHLDVSMQQIDQACEIIRGMAPIGTG